MHSKLSFQKQNNIKLTCHEIFDPTTRTTRSKNTVHSSSETWKWESRTPEAVAAASIAAPGTQEVGRRPLECF